MIGFLATVLAGCAGEAISGATPAAVNTLTVQQTTGRRESGASGPGGQGAAPAPRHSTISLDDSSRVSPQQIDDPSNLKRQTRLNLQPGADRLYQNSRTAEEIAAHKATHPAAREYPAANRGSNGAPLRDSGLEEVPAVP